MGCSSSGGTAGSSPDGAAGSASDASAGLDASGGASGSAGADASPWPDGGGDATVDAGPTYPFPTKLEHVFVFVKENHSFDNYFTGFPGAATTTTAKLSDGTTITRAKVPAGAMDGDISHTHASAFKAWNGGKMNQFDLLAGYNVKGNSVRFAYYPESRIPNYWALAKSFVLFDHFFSTTLAPSNPGHIAIWAAQSPAEATPAPAAAAWRRRAPPSIPTTPRRARAAARSRASRSPVWSTTSRRRSAGARIRPARTAR